MDVERTMNFILDSQAKAEVRMDRLERQVAATANLLRGAIRVGARQLREAREAQKHTDQRLVELAEVTERKLQELAESQRLTDQRFRAFLDSFGKTQNGN